MPIRINLLAEAQAAEEARKKDPVKRIALIGGVLVFAVIVYSALLQLQVIAANGEAANAQARWKDMEKDYGAVTQDLIKTVDLQTRLASLQRLSTNRFLWAPVLDALQQTTVEGVQLVRMRGDHNYAQIEAVPPKLTAKPPVPGQPAASVEKITMFLEARDYGNPTEQNYNRFKAAIQNFPFFREYLTKPDAVRLTSLSPPAQDPASGRNFVQFTLECQFPETKRDE